MNKVKNGNFQNNKLLDPKNDVVFHTLFRQKNNKLIEAFLSSVLNEDVKIVSNLDRHLDISKVTQKFSVMDLNAELSDRTKCNIEMQLRKHDGELERFLYYLSNSYARQLKKSAEYGKMARCINIAIVNHEIEELKYTDNFITKWTMMDTETGRKILTNKFELYIMILPRVVKSYLKDRNNKLAHWGMFFAEPYSEEVKAIMAVNKDIKDAKEELDNLNGDYETQRLADIREKAIHDEVSALEYVKKQGLKEGVKRGKMETSKRLIERGVPLEDIVEITGLTKEEISKLK